MAFTIDLKEKVVLVVPVGAIVRQAMLRRPYFFMSSYSFGSAAARRWMNGLFCSRSLLYISKAPRSLAISTEER